LPRQEEEAEEPYDDSINRLIGDLGVNPANLREICSLGGPHGRGAETKEYAGRYQGIEFRIELRADVWCVAEHRYTEGPLDGEPFDEESGYKNT